MGTLLTLIHYEICASLRRAFSCVTPLLFFVIVVTLFPLSVSRDVLLLKEIAPGIIWVAALLAVLLAIGDLFERDAREGYLDLVLQSHCPLPLWVMAKLFAHWLTHCLPLIIISPLLGFLLHLPAYENYALIVGLLLGTPTLTLLGAIGAALMVGIRHHGLLLPILIMPLYIPVLIFGTGTLMAAANQEPLSGYFALMGAFLLLSFAFAPLLTSVALRIGVNQ